MAGDRKLVSFGTSVVLTAKKGKLGAENRLPTYSCQTSYPGKPFSLLLNDVIASDRPKQCHYITATKGICVGQPQRNVGLAFDAQFWGKCGGEGLAEASGVSPVHHRSKCGAPWRRRR